MLKFSDEELEKILICIYETKASIENNNNNYYLNTLFSINNLEDLENKIKEFITFNKY